MAVAQEQLRRRRIAPAASLMLCLAPALLGTHCFGKVGTNPAPPAARTRRVGSLELRPCPTVAAYGGGLAPPLDPSGPLPGRISIHFESYPHSEAGKALETLVATEGGPGYP